MCSARGAGSGTSARIAAALVVLLVASHPGAGAQEQKLFGFVGVASQDLGKLEGAGILTNTGVIDMAQVAQVPAWNEQPSRSRPIVVLDDLFFVLDRRPRTPCRPYTWRLLADWKQRGDRWFAANQQYLTSDKIAGLVPNDEANNGCLDPAVLQLVTRYIKTKVPRDVRIGFGEGAPGRGARPLLSSVPAGIDFVAIFDYDTLDPHDPSLQAALDEVRGMLRPRQSYVLVPKAFLFPSQIGKIEPRELGVEMTAYARYCKSERQCLGVVGFLYDSVAYPTFENDLVGTDQMPGAWPGDAEASHILLGPTP
jgi:hypothetical protein